jgi:putative toxin-antitoxin system antitoxin component (TIGR02293 family)
LDSVGLLPPFLEAAEYIRGARVYGAGLTEFRAMTLKGLGCRYEFQYSLPQYEAQRIIKPHLVSIGAHAVAVFSDEQKASHWLATPLARLGNRSPVQILARGGDFEAIDQILTRIEHNIPS